MIGPFFLSKSFVVLNRQQLWEKIRLIIGVQLLIYKLILFYHEGDVHFFSRICHCLDHSSIQCKHER